MILERLRPDHITAVDLQPNQIGLQTTLTHTYAAELASQKGVGWAAVAGGRVLGCAGIVEIWPTRAIAWALLSTEALANFIPIHRATRNVLNDAPWRRVEMHVDVEHAAAIRWAERLGFACEGLMRAFTVDGRDCFLYAKVK